MISDLFIIQIPLAMNLISLIHSKTTTSDPFLVTIGEKMKNMGIIPHIIPTAPSDVTDIFFKNYFFSSSLQRNHNIMPHHKLIRQPEISWMRCDTKKYYSFFMTLVNVTGSNSEDLNPENLQNATQYHKWMYINVPNCLFTGADEVFKYEPPTSNENDEHDIYLFLIFEQKEGKIWMGFKERYSHYFFRDRKFHNSHRSEFTIKEFMDHFDVDLVAGNYMRVTKSSKRQTFIQKYVPFNFITTIVKSFFYAM